MRLRLASATGLALLATAARTLGLPLSRHRFDGHEGDYLRAFQGELLEGSTRLYPLLAGLYQGLGALTQDSRVLLALNILAGVLTVLAAGAFVERKLGPQAGLLVGLLLALSPTHLFWSASAYNVAIPQALLVGACALGVLEHRIWRWAGIPLYALACGMRAELALLAPAVALLAGWRTALGALGLALAWPVLDTAPSLHSPWTVLPLNLRLLPWLGAALPFALVGASRKSLPWLGAALYVHLLGSCFDDYGSRHALFGVLATSGALAAGFEGWRRWLAAPALLLSLAGCWLVHERYYASAQDYAATLEEQGPPPDCGEVLDDPLPPESHFHGLPERPCWGEEHHHYAWTSRGARGEHLLEAQPGLDQQGDLELVDAGRARVAQVRAVQHGAARGLQPPQVVDRRGAAAEGPEGADDGLVGPGLDGLLGQGLGRGVGQQVEARLGPAQGGLLAQGVHRDLQVSAVGLLGDGQQALFGELGRAGQRHLDDPGARLVQRDHGRARLAGTGDLVAVAAGPPALGRVARGRGDHRARPEHLQRPALDGQELQRSGQVDRRDQARLGQLDRRVEVGQVDVRVDPAGHDPGAAQVLALALDFRRELDDRALLDPQIDPTDAHDLEALQEPRRGLGDLGLRRAGQPPQHHASSVEQTD